MGRRVWRWLSLELVIVLGCVLATLAGGLVGLSVYGSATPSPAARGSGHDAEWLGHAWVDGRRTQADVDTLAGQLRGTGIRDLFVHAGPFSNDGTLDPRLRPRARWLVAVLHAALPGVRVQAWLGAHLYDLPLSSARNRSAVVSSVDSVLADGFDGVHLDFEPVDDGDADLLALLDTAHELTARRHALLSISATFPEPASGVAAALALVPHHFTLWSGPYLHQVAVRVDQVAVMAYDTWLPTSASYAGYVRDATLVALAEVPPSVALLIGVPAYHEDGLRHHAGAETMPAAIRGVRLALGDQAPRREFGIAVYVDFTATPADWAAYHDYWA
jgi:hypothetical protein